MSAVQVSELGKEKNGFAASVVLRQSFCPYYLLSHNGKSIDIQILFSQTTLMAQSRGILGSDWLSLNS